MKSKLSLIWRMAVALVLVFSLGAVFATPAAAEPDLRHLEVDYPDKVYVCGEFDVVAEICVDDGGDIIDDAVVRITLPNDDPKAILVGEAEELSAEHWVGDVCPKKCRETTFTLKCIKPGLVDDILIEVFEADDPGTILLSDTIDIDQQCKLEVKIKDPKDIDPVDGVADDPVVISDVFGVTAEVYNKSGEICNDAEVCLVIDGGNASLVPIDGSLCFALPPIAPGGVQMANWTVHCDGKGDAQLTVTAYGCGVPRECAAACADTLTVHQPALPEPPPPPCSLEVEILPPGPQCFDEDACPCEEFPVKVRVTHTGTDGTGNDLSGWVQLKVTGGSASFLSGPPSYQDKEFGPISPGNHEDVEFSVHCDDAPAPTLGGAACDGTSDVHLKAEAYGTCQGGGRDGWGFTNHSHGQHDWTPGDTDTTYDTAGLPYINQTWIKLNLFDIDGEPLKTCRDFCVGDDIIIRPVVKNCSTTEDWVNGLVTLESYSGGIHPVTSTDPRTVTTLVPEDSTDLDEITPFHFKCNSAGEAYFTFSAKGVYPPTTTVCDWDTINIHQKDLASLDVTLDAPDCAKKCEEYKVTATVWHDGGTYTGDVTNVKADLSIFEGCAKIWDPDGSAWVAGPVTLDVADKFSQGEPSVDVTWEVHCECCTDVIWNVDAYGKDEVCNKTIHAYDDDPTKQVDFDVTIIHPQACDSFDVSKTFCVTAQLENTDCDNICTVNAVWIEFPSGKAELLPEETNPKILPTPMDCAEVQEVSWTVHCTAPGETDVLVWADVTCDGCQVCDKWNVYDSITVYQKSPPIKVKILSPDNGYLVATSEDFAVTAKVTNDGSSIAYYIPVTIDPGHKTSVVGPVVDDKVEVTQVVERLDPGESATLTWTLHCEEGVNEWVKVEAIGAEPVSDKVLIIQYPAAHLEVEITEVLPDTTVSVCDNFTVKYKITNTGEADATDVKALLSVTPDGSARPVEGIDSGYTQDVGTLTGHGQDGDYTGEWELHCKEACESTIVITAEGNDEYGWHKKQQCQSTGTFLITDGEMEKWAWCPPLQDETVGCVGFEGWFKGESEGLIGDFKFEADVAYNYNDQTCCQGTVSMWGNIIEDRMEFAGFMCDLDPCDPTISPEMIDCFPWSEVFLDVDKVDKFGEIQVINGMLMGNWTEHPCGIPGEWVEVVLTNGLFCSTMASTPGMAINEDFIEPGSVTVKQITPAQLVVDISYPENGAEFTELEDFVVTATVTNIGEETADTVNAKLAVDAHADITDPTKSLDAIVGGDWEVVTWAVHCESAGFSVFTATAEGTGELSDNDLEAFDTLTVKQGEVPDAQLVVDISHPENDAEFTKGDEFVVTATVTNIGETEADLVNVTIAISANAHMDSGPIGWPQDIGAGDAVVASWTLICDDAGFSVITVTAEGTNSNSAVAPVTVKQVAPPEPYLTVEVSAPAQVFKGETFTVTAVVSNIGDADADAVDVDMTASGLVIPTSDSDSIGTIDAGDSVVAEFPLECTGEGGVNVHVEAYGPDTNTAADSAAVQQINVPEGVATLTVDLSAPAQVFEGETFTVTAVVSNIGDADAAGVDVDMTASGLVTPTSDSDSIGTIDAGDSVVAEFPLECTGEGGVNVYVEAYGPDTNTAADSAAVQQVETSANADLAVTKDVDNPNPDVDEDVVYTITVTNYGPTNASGVVVTDDLWDSVVSYVSDVPTQGTYDDTSRVWTIGDLTVGASATLMITAHVTSTDEFINTATVTCDQPDGNPANDTDSAVINRSLAIQLEEGWNFVSWPLIPDDPGIETSPGVLDDLAPLTTNVDSVWGNFDPVEPNPILQWDTYDPESITNTLTEMHDGVGFWIDMKTAGLAIVIEGQEQPDPPDPPRVYEVVGGGVGGYWNAIAFKSTTAKSRDVYLEGIAGKYTVIYGFDEGVYFVVGTPGHENLEPGLAYWLAVLESGNIFP